MKVLIFKKANELRPIGGPAGYNYNLKRGIDALADTNGIDFFYLESDEKSFGNRVKDYIKKKVVSKLSKSVKARLTDHYVVADCKQVLKGLENGISFDNYDIIHFHSTLDMYKNRHALKNFNGKIILSSHCPKAQHVELVDDVVTDNCAKKNELLFKKMKMVDEWCFDNASFIFFPCEEAMEPYFQSWDEFADIYRRNKSKFRYILSGLEPVYAKKTKSEIREHYDIPFDAKVVCFVGRHNITKGYDTLIELYKKCPDVYFLLAGATSSIEYPKDKRWIEVGWTNDPYSIVNASDLFVLPNKQTYFDLVLLEVLSLGIPVLLSNTGGNKYFTKYNNLGFLYFDTVDEAEHNINSFFDKTMDERIRMGEENRKLFMEVFDSSKFAKSYCDLLKSL